MLKWFLTTLVLMLGAAGCVQNEGELLGRLPTRSLLPERSNYPASVTTCEHPQIQDRPDHPWAAKGCRQWRYIVIHHSATDFGNAATFDVSHRLKGWDEMGYHFVIDNGRGGPAGRVEVGSRWKSQKWGAHCGGTPDNEYNNHGIGICMVGDFTEAAPSEKQLESLRRLVAYLAETYQIPPDRVIGHNEAPASNTTCPGATLSAFIHNELRSKLPGELVSAE